MSKNESMINVVDEFLNSSKNPQKLTDIIAYVAKEKEFEVSDVDKINQLYLDISTSGKYVYVGDNMWDLKERNLEFWDKDGIAFLSEDEKKQLVESDEAEVLDFADFDQNQFLSKLNKIKEQPDLEDDEEIEIEELTQEEKEVIKEEAEYLDIELPDSDPDSEEKINDIKNIDFEFDEFNDDEDKYNEAMDDYEYLYED